MEYRLLSGITAAPASANWPFSLLNNGDHRYRGKSYIEDKYQNIASRSPSSPANPEPARGLQQSQRSPFAYFRHTLSVFLDILLIKAFTALIRRTFKGYPDRCYPPPPIRRDHIAIAHCRCERSYRPHKSCH